MPYLGCLVGTAYHKMLSRLEKALRRAGAGITATEYLVLRALDCRDGLQQCEIGEMVGKDKAAVCRTVGALARKGLLTTESVSRKCTRAWLTAAGRQLEPVVMQVASERHDELASMVSPADMAVFERVLSAIVKQ